MYHVAVPIDYLMTYLYRRCPYFTCSFRRRAVGRLITDTEPAMKSMFTLSLPHLSASTLTKLFSKSVVFLFLMKNIILF